jgi:hypothetical protein
MFKQERRVLIYQHGTPEKVQSLEGGFAVKAFLGP